MPGNNAQILKDDYGFDTAAAREELVRLAHAALGGQVLDVGTGCGSMAVVLAQHGFGVTTVDFDAQAIECAKLRAQQAGKIVADRIRFVRGDALRLPFEGQSFDAVFSFDSLHHLPDCNAAVEEMLRVLRPGGVFAAADVNDEGARAIDEVFARKDDAHFHNQCRVDVIGKNLGEMGIQYHRHRLEFVTVFIAAGPVENPALGKPAG